MRSTSRVFVQHTTQIPMAAAVNAISYKLTAVVAYKAEGDIFHDIMSKRQHHLANTVPSKCQACLLHEGNYGEVGSIIEWKYTLEGKEQRAKQVVEEIDDEKRHVRYKILEGDDLELYRDVTVIFDVETKDGIDYISWSVEYELLKPDNPHPFYLINFFIELTKDVEAYHLQE